MSIYMGGRVRFIAVILKTTCPEMDTRVQIPTHMFDSVIESQTCKYSQWWYWVQKDGITNK